MYFGVKVRIGRTNQNVNDMLDLARRQADHLGPDGIKSKRRQKNGRYARKGVLRFPLRTRRQARKLDRRIRALGEPSIQVTRFKNPNRYPY